MSDTYTKLFSSITTSTIVSEPLHVRWLWVTMLAAVKSDGVVYGSIPGLARLANVPIDQCEDGLKRLMEPDPYSRTQDNEGRRIEAVDGGWKLLNHAKYDSIRNEAERAEYKRRWDKEHRPSGHQRNKQSDKSPTVRQKSDTSPTKPDSPTASTSTSTVKEPPISPKGDEPKIKSAKAKGGAITLATYLADCEDRKVEPIPKTDAVWRSAKASGLPEDWIPLAWWAFQGRYLANPGDKAKRYTSWPQAFRNCVRENWLKLWWPTDDGGYRLSPAGVQAQREMESAA